MNITCVMVSNWIQILSAHNRPLPPAPVSSVEAPAGTQVGRCISRSIGVKAYLQRASPRSRKLEATRTGTRRGHSRTASAVGETDV